MTETVGSVRCCWAGCWSIHGESAFSRTAPGLLSFPAFGRSVEQWLV